MSLPFLLLESKVTCKVAVGATVILMAPPLHSLGVSTGMERESQQNDSLADALARAWWHRAGAAHGSGGPTTGSLQAKTQHSLSVRLARAVFSGKIKHQGPNPEG